MERRTCEYANLVPSASFLLQLDLQRVLGISSRVQLKIENLVDRWIHLDEY
jgi:hypothetical protein